MTNPEDQHGHIPSYTYRPTKTGTLLVTKKESYPQKDYKKVNKTRRSRGYNFEYNLVNAFNNHVSGEWYARRLGGSSTGLPDVVVTNNTKSILYAIECKSGESNRLYIPKDQINRCTEITTKFLSSFKYRFIVFAYKFKATERRKLQYRIIPIFIDGVPPNYQKTKHVCYDIVKDCSIVTYNDGKTKRVKLTNPLSFIEEFVNWNVVTECKIKGWDRIDVMSQ